MNKLVLIGGAGIGAYFVWLALQKKKLKEDIENNIIAQFPTDHQERILNMKTHFYPGLNLSELKLIHRLFHWPSYYNSNFWTLEMYEVFTDDEIFKLHEIDDERPNLDLIPGVSISN